MGSNQERIDKLNKYGDVIQKQIGRAVRPDREDGFVNLMTKYGTQKDSSEHYVLEREPSVMDDTLVTYYEGSGLFAKIIDAPAEEALRAGFEIKNLADEKTETFYKDALDQLDWKENATTAIKWARLFGGAIAVMLIDDGRGLEEPLDWKNIQSIEDIKVYERAVVTPDMTNLFQHRVSDPLRTRGSVLGEPEYYDVSSKYGSFRVHESRCLVFKNGRLPENAVNSYYQIWGMPEYHRIHRAVRDAEVAHGSSVKLLDRSVQAIYKMKGLAAELATEQGEDAILRRLNIIDQAKGLMNSIAIDSEGEDYDYKTFSFSGVSDVINSTCNLLSAVTNIPQTVLFGRSPAGQNATGESDLENYYDYVGRIQETMLKKNIRRLLSVIFTAGKATGEIEKIPKLDIEFNPLWSLSEAEKISIDQQKAQLQQTKASTAQIYVGMQALDPQEVRKALASENEFDIDTLLDEYSEEELMANKPEAPQGEPQQGEAPQGIPTEKAKETDEDDLGRPGVGVLVVKDGKILVGNRHNDHGYGLWCGPGGKIEPGETARDAAIRETREEFGITPTELYEIGELPLEAGYDKPAKEYLCTAYEGEPTVCDGLEMVNPRFVSLEEIKANEADLFQPFRDSLDLLADALGEGFSEQEEAEQVSEETAEDKKPIEGGILARMFAIINSKLHKNVDR